MRVDPARLGVIGHSFGGGAAPAIAARAQARGWGREALFIACLAPWYDLDAAAWAKLPAHAYLSVLLYEDDAVCDPAIGAAFLTRAVTLAPERKALRVFRSDRHGRPRVVADHLAPLSTPKPDTLDLRGTWRALDALAAAAAGSPDGRAVALGSGADALALGTWSDGTALRPALPTFTHATGDDRRLGWRLGGVQEETFRRLLRTETWSSLPLSDPTLAAPARLPPPPERALRGSPARGAAGRQRRTARGRPAIAGRTRRAECLRGGPTRRSGHPGGARPRAAGVPAVEPARDDGDVPRRHRALCALEARGRPAPRRRRPRAGRALTGSLVRPAAAGP